MLGAFLVVIPTSADTWMTSTDFAGIKDLVADINFHGAAFCRDKWEWKSMWDPVVHKFCSVEIPDLLELANMDERDPNPLASKKITIFRSMSDEKLF